MGVFDIFRRRTAASSPLPENLEARTAVQSMTAQAFYEALNIPWGGNASDILVTTETALGVPSIWAAVNFIPGTLAGLPMHLYRRNGEDGRQRVNGTPLARILHDAVNPECSSFEWRKYSFEQTLTGGRQFTFIERIDGVVINLWPLDPSRVTVRRERGAKLYDYRDGARMVTYTAAEIIDIPYMLRADGLSHRGPIAANRDVIALAIASTQFGSKFFQNGGVPPFAVTGSFQSGQAMGRAADDLADATRKAAKERRMALVLPQGLEIKALGVDAEKSQMVELKRFLIEEIARIYSLPPVFLQDLTHGTFSNTEQQDLQLVKHTIKRWVEAFEQEMNLKLFGRGKSRYFVEMNMDGLLRGDFKTRMDGYAQGIQNGVLMPNEARRKENMPDDPAGNRLMIQGATVPIDTLAPSGTNGEGPPDDPTTGQGGGNGT
jgi:HK97 family phage portal protein